MPSERIPAPSKKVPRKALGLTKSLLIAGTLHAGALAAPTAYDEAKEAHARYQQRAERARDRQQLEQERSALLAEARAAQIENRPWSGRFLIRSWFIEKRAAQEPHSDEQEILGRYQGLLDHLRHDLRNGGTAPSHEQIQRALSHAFEGYDYWLSDGHPVDLLREHGGACSAIGLLTSSLLHDLGLREVGIRIYSPNPQDVMPIGHIEGTIRLPTAQGTTAEYGLQHGGPVGANGVYVPVRDFLNHYRPGSIGLAFPSPRTAEERRPLPAGAPTIVPFSQGIVSSHASEGQRPQDQALSAEEARNLIQRIPTTIERVTLYFHQRSENPIILGERTEELPNAFITPTSVRTGYSRQDWSNTSEYTQTLIQTAAALELNPESPVSRETNQRLRSSIYATLSLLHLQMSQEAALERRNAASRALEQQSRAEQERARQSFTSLNTASVLSDRVASLEEPLIELLPSVRQHLFEQVQNDLQNRDSMSTFQTTRAVQGLFQLLRYAHEPATRAGSLANLERLAQDTRRRGILYAHMRFETGTIAPDGSRSGPPFVGDHPFIARLNIFNEFRESLSDEEVTQIIETSATRQAFEQQIERLFRQRFAHRAYDPAYPVAIFITRLLSLHPYMRDDLLRTTIRMNELYQTDPYFSPSDPWMEHRIHLVRSIQNSHVQHGPTIHIPLGQAMTTRSP